MLGYWFAKNGEYLLEITPNAWQSLEAECSKAYEMETGGILIGYYSDDRLTAVITEATSPPKDSTFGNYWFVRGVAGLKTLLTRRWKNVVHRTYYLGEWHYHPADHVTPSDDDFRQMVVIGKSANYQCREPIMLIIGQKYNEMRPIRAYVYPYGRQSYEYIYASRK
jgi:integrative and conjugative element protein (TIGR02256 family)